ncbi:hypothetical protein M514_06100 [Trichuris suis]|uniref:Integrase zinc-binding domain-containing protein n=1 Tax=Trichuris suis TaxID=68888 RepID=A0A085NK90_9BILA|nr:hypothetical protein M513_06100 [Trichuris suis]KFD69886.1 hypothetical protein M514_06100 [Trichuris suis]
MPNSAVWCELSHDRARPSVAAPLRREVFNTLHSLSHPGIRATRRLVTEHYVWPSMNRDIGLVTFANEPRFSNMLEHRRVLSRYLIGDSATSIWTLWGQCHSTEIAYTSSL